MTDEIQVAGWEKVDCRMQDLTVLDEGSVFVPTASSFLRTDFDPTAHRFDADGDPIGTRTLREEVRAGIGGSFWSSPGAEAAALDGGVPGRVDGGVADPDP